MVIVIIITVIVSVLEAAHGYRVIKRRRARKRAAKLQAAGNPTVPSLVTVDGTEGSLPEDEVIVGKESTSGWRPFSPPPYSAPSPHPYEPSESPLISGSPDLSTVPELTSEASPRRAALPPSIFKIRDYSTDRE